MRSNVKSFIAAGLGALVVLFVFGIVNLLSDENTSEKNTNSIQSHQASKVSYLPSAQNGIDFIRASELSVNAVVHIRTEIQSRTNNYDDFFGALRDYFEGNSYRKRTQSSPLIAFGSGVIISNDGYIVTNNHVVEGSDKISVTLNDKREYKAKIVGLDPNTDLALVKIDAEDLPFLTYGDSDKVKVGEWVLAVGNPFNLTSTVTAGIVSAKARNINILGSRSAIESFIQTDAVVNRGNSGGALVNVDGELVGINAAIASHTGSYEGYSFAIPVNIVRKVVDDLLNYGEAQRPYLGVTIREIDEELAEQMNLKNLKGVYVESVVSDGGAGEAGIKSGDVILSINGVSVNSFAQLVGAVNQHRPGETVKIKYVHKGKEKEVNVLLRNSEGTTTIVKAQDSFYNAYLGANLKKATKQERSKLRLDGGLKVLKVQSGVLQTANIKTGFIITKINNMEVNSKEDLDVALNASSKILRIEGVSPNGIMQTFEFLI
ncbi:MAG: S1C family serine protease [Bacteroidales bacterium]